jgi:hypothetical protein
MTRRRSLAPVTALLLIAAISVSTAEAQTHAASYVDDHGTLLTKIRSAVIKVIGTRGDRVEVAIAGDVLTVTRVNSTMNQTGHVARASDAARITAAVAATIAGEPEFKHVHTIRVLYVNRARPATHGKVIDAVNFKQDQRGAFVPHAT